jgi:tetratricopeptide (TPR) repeat protein
MTERLLDRGSDNRVKLGAEELLRLLRTRFEAADQVRRGVCLLNAGRYDEAEAAFARAAEVGSTDQSLPSYMAACLLGQGRADAAVDTFARLATNDDSQPAARVRHALTLWAAGKSDEAIQSLREGISLDSECAELHFQLGTLLTSLEKYDEAELRFTQALNIERDHTEALVSLAMCCAIRNAPGEALAHLRKAQARRPHDARIGLLLTQAAKAVQQWGHAVRVCADMPSGEPAHDDRGIDELARAIEAEPDFVEAFLALPVGQVDEDVFAVLLKAIDATLERHRGRAEFYYLSGRVLDRMGRQQDAIAKNEEAVRIAPGFTQALIELAKLYQKTDRTADAVTRLEQAIAAGADYADVHFRLGNLYRDQGRVGRARSAYKRALVLNERYDAAVKALEALAVT